MLIIGLCGQPSSGKDTAADYLAQLGLVHISNGDRIREDMKREGLPLDRSSMREYAGRQRQAKGRFYPVNEVCPLITGDTVITGFRNTAEVGYIKDFFGSGFVLVSLEAPFELRYERAKSRNRHGDDISVADFKAQEEAERSSDSESHEVDKVMAMADYHLINSGTAADLYRKLDELLARLRNIALAV